MRRVAFGLVSGLAAFLAVSSCSLNPQPLPPLTATDAASGNVADAAFLATDAARDSAGGGYADANNQPSAADGGREAAEAAADAPEDTPADALDGGNADGRD